MDDVTTTQIGTLTRMERSARQWSGTDLGNEIDRSRTWVSQLETGKVDPTFTMIRQIAHLFGYSVVEYLQRAQEIET
jgi:transcriptional regulator with XRE-family HTH domain